MYFTIITVYQKIQKGVLTPPAMITTVKSNKDIVLIKSMHLEAYHHRPRHLHQNLHVLPSLM